MLYIRINKIVLFLLIFFLSGFFISNCGIYLFKSVGYDNMMGAFNGADNNFAFYENPALIESKKSYMSYYNKYSMSELNTALISQSYQIKFLNFGIYLLHFQKRPYKEEEYGLVLSKEVFDSFKIGINLKYLRNVIFDQNYYGFSYDIGGYYGYKNHNFGISFKNVEKPYLAERVNMDFIFKYSYIRDFYRINFRYVKIYSLYEYYLIGCEFDLSEKLKLSYSLVTEKNENRIGIKFDIKRYLLDIGYIVHPGLKNYFIAGIGVKW